MRMLLACPIFRRMSEVLDMAAIAALVGDPARANILCALLDGRALTASQLAYPAHVTPQTASRHLVKLSAASLIVPSQRGPPPSPPPSRPPAAPLLHTLHP